MFSFVFWKALKELFSLRSCTFPSVSTCFFTDERSFVASNYQMFKLLRYFDPLFTIFKCSLSRFTFPHLRSFSILFRVVFLCTALDTMVGKILIPVKGTRLARVTNNLVNQFLSGARFFPMVSVGVRKTKFEWRERAFLLPFTTCTFCYRILQCRRERHHLPAYDTQHHE